MNILGKDLKEYVSAIKMPVIVNIAVSVIGVILAVFAAVLTVASGPAGVCIGIITGIGYLVISIVIGIASALYVGYLMAKKKSSTLMQAAVAGAIFGITIGVVGGVLNIIGSVVNIALSVGTLGTN